MPVGVGKGVIHGGIAVGSGVGHGIGAVGGFAGRRIGLIKKKDKSGKEVLVQSEIAEGDEPVEVLADGHADGFAVTNGVAASDVLGALKADLWSEPGILNVTVLRAKDLKSEEGNKVKPFVQLKMAGKSHKTGHVKGVEPEWYVKRCSLGLRAVHC